MRKIIVALMLATSLVMPTFAHAQSNPAFESVLNDPHSGPESAEADILPLNTAEQAYQLAYLQLSSALEFYLNSLWDWDSKYEGKPEYKLAQAELDHLIKPEFKMSLPRLVFYSEAKRPGFFLLDGQVRVAKTGTKPNSSAWGDVIYINQDLIRASENPEDLTDATVTLIHELGHQMGIQSHDWLDRVGNEVKNLLLKNRYSIPLSAAEPVRGFLTVYNFTYIGARYQMKIAKPSNRMLTQEETGLERARVYVTSTKEIVDISRWLYEHDLCKYNGPHSVLRSTYISNLSISDLGKTSLESASSRDIPTSYNSVSSNAYYFCTKALFNQSVHVSFSTHFLDLKDNSPLNQRYINNFDAKSGIGSKPPVEICIYQGSCGY